MTNGDGYDPRKAVEQLECPYCGKVTPRVLTCPTCGGEFCEDSDCLMPAGSGVKCLACEESIAAHGRNSPCDVDDDEPDWGGSWGDQT